MFSDNLARHEFKQVICWKQTTHLPECVHCQMHSVLSITVLA